MTDHDSTWRTQSAVFCVELHGHIGDLDSQAAMFAARLRALADPDGRPGGTALTRALQDKLKRLAAERRRVMAMLAAMGHRYPCSHG